MKIEKNWFDRMITIVSLVTIIGTAIFLIVYWNQIPDQIPGHYNGSGQIDKMTDKSSLLFLYGITWLLYILFLGIEKYPAIWNTGVTITPENKEKIYRILKDMLGALKCILVLIFCFLTIYSTTGNNLPNSFLLVALGCVFGSMAISLIRVFMARK